MFKYRGKILCFAQDQLNVNRYGLIFYPINENEITDIEKFEADERRAIEDAHVVRNAISYKSFCDNLYYIKNEKSEGIWRFYLKEDGIYLFKIITKINEQNGSATFSQAELHLYYKYENDLVKNIFVRDIFKGIQDAVSVIQSAEHNFEIFVNPQILKVIVGCKILDRTHKSIYFNFERTMPNGKVRLLSKPNDEILDSLVDLNKFFKLAYEDINRGIQIAYKSGSSIIDNAYPHKDHRYIEKADISNFFPSCKRPLVTRVVRYAFNDSYRGYSLMKYFLDKMLVDNGLCLGNPISPIIANQIVAKSARDIYNICRSTGITFTQYCDDITFSSDRPISKNLITNIFERVYTKNGLIEYFTLKPEKMFGQTGQYRNVTSIAFDHTNNNKPTNRRYLYRHLRVTINNYAHGDTNIDMQKAKGQVAYMVMCGQGERILKYLNKFDLETKRAFMSERLEEKINNNEQVVEEDGLYQDGVFI